MKFGKPSKSLESYYDNRRKDQEMLEQMVMPGDFELDKKSMSKKELGKKVREEYPLYFLEMNSRQDAFIRVKNEFGRTPNRRLFEAGNKEGKTFSGISEDLAHAMGFRPWLKKDDPDYKINIKTPNIGMIGCETHKHSVAEKIEPLLRWMTPKVCLPVFKPGPTGVLTKLVLTNDAWGKKLGSIIYIRSYDEEAASYEGIDFDWIHWDEPPPEAVFKAAERGKVVTNAPSWFTMTPLKEAWIHSMLSMRAAIVI